jgi:hypothetical protein
MACSILDDPAFRPLSSFTAVMNPRSPIVSETSLISHFVSSIDKPQRDEDALPVI